MRHKKFVVTSTAIMIVCAGIVAGLAFYSDFAATASIPSVPKAVRWLPTGSQAVFGMNVKKFVESPFYKRIEAKQGERVGHDLQEFIASTGVDPQKDLDYILVAGRSGDHVKGEGVAIAVGTFNTAGITSFIKTKGAPIEVPYKKGKVLMIPESDGNKLEKGIAYLSENEIALGDLESLKQVLDIQAGDAAGIDTTNLGLMLRSVDPEEMFWFAGDAASVMAQVPVNTPLGNNLSSIQTIFGTLDLTEVVKGKVTLRAKDKDAARKLADVVRGFVALGQLAASNTQNAELASLVGQITLQVDSAEDVVNLNLSFPLSLLDQMEQLKMEQHRPKKVV
jgi:hypothetical protein